MERKIANIDEFQMGENGIPLFPVGLKEETSLYVLPDGDLTGSLIFLGGRSAG